MLALTAGGSCSGPLRATTQPAARLPSSPSSQWGGAILRGSSEGILQTSRAWLAQHIPGARCILFPVPCSVSSSCCRAPAPPRWLGLGCPWVGVKGALPECQDLRGSATIHTARPCQHTWHTVTVQPLFVSGSFSQCAFGKPACFRELL